MDLQEYLRDVPDFPRPGIVFKDLTPLLAAPEAFREALDRLEALIRPMRPTRLAAMESRGFLFAAPLADRLACGLIPLRKPGKLPWKTFREAYSLEYGENVLEVHQDGADAADRVVLVDDLLATGGTAAAALRLVRRLGAEVAGAVFLVELDSLGGRDQLPDLPVHGVIRISG